MQRGSIVKGICAPLEIAPKFSVSGTQVKGWCPWTEAEGPGSDSLGNWKPENLGFSRMSETTRVDLV